MIASHHVVPAVSLPPARIASAQSGTAMSKPRPTSRPENRDSLTPTISKGCASRVTVAPIAEGLPPNSRCQNAWLTTARAAHPR